ncbi:unnamed protein product [Euphydryas editha]|uniref:UDP-glucuronosyltransferase n=1 Tax=Euphydryas editha TaxID=104508 RepID=A0AAU9UGB5_EUPED|nr:unnamed protein product [Euphydryas editha]
MKGLLFYIILFIFHVDDIRAARILAVFPLPSISHQLAFQPLTDELVRRGHEVTVITTDPKYPPGQTPKNLKEIDVHDLSYRIWRDVLFQKSFNSIENIYDQMGAVFRTGSAVFYSVIQTKEVQDIINKKHGEYDLILLEACVRSALIFSHYFKVPVIQISSMTLLKYHLRAAGADTHPLLYPTQFHQRLYNLTRLEKLQQLYTHYRMENQLDEIEEEDSKMLKSILGSDVPPLRELSNNVHMLFSNVHPIWVENQPVPPNVVFIGGVHVPPPNPLPQDLQSYLDSSKNGVIYFSLGTNVRPSVLSSEKIDIFIKVFSQLPYDIMWKWDKDKLPGKSENIKIFKWLPQSDLLRHPNVKLFITQGGQQSSDEAINAGVPLIGIPMLGDQWFNVEKYVHHKIGVKQDMATLNQIEFKQAIETVINDKSYRENIKRLRSIMLDQPQSPLERAVWWMEHTLRHGGAMHLRAAGANFSWAEYMELELVLIVLITIVFILILISVSLYKLWNVMRQNIKDCKKQKAI